MQKMNRKSKYYGVLVLVPLIIGALLVSQAWAPEPPPPPPPPPPCGDEGCTPGYWKQPHHFDSWEVYAPEDDFNAVFGAGPQLTLEDALWARGGGLNKLLRHGTAALLNAAHGDVEYPLTVAAVLSLVQAAIASGDRETYIDTADILVEYNEYGCPLN